MSQIAKILDDLKLDRAGLLELSKLAARRAADMRPVYVKQVYKKCGKLNCWCVDEKNEVHGPYLYAVYMDQGRQVQRSLGRFYNSDEIEAMRSRRSPRWLDFVYTGKTLDKLRVGPDKWDLNQHELSPAEFEEFYGVSMEDDGLSRPRSLWFNYAEYSKAMHDHVALIDIAVSPFSRLGVCTSKGYSTLKSLVERGYYLAD